MKNKKWIIRTLICLSLGAFAYGLVACGENGVGSALSDAAWNKNATQDLGYKLSSDETYYILNGMGFCEEENIIIPSVYNNKPVKEINGFAGDENVKTVKIPASVRKISNSFHSSTKLESIEVQSGSKYFQAIDGNLYDDEGTEFVRYAIGKTATEYSIPEGVTKIAKNAFKGNENLKKLTVCDTYKTAEAEALSYLDGITEVTLGRDLTVIAKDMFADSKELETVRYTASITEIGERAFYHCESLQEIYIPSSVEKIGEYAFMDCNALQIVRIDDIAAWCNIEFANDNSNPLMHYGTSDRTLYINGQKVAGALVIPDTVQNVPAYAFYGQTAVTALTIGKGVKSLGDDAFSRLVNVTTVNFNAEECVLNDGTYGTVKAFEQLGDNVQNLTVNFGSGVKSVPDNLFEGNTKIKKVSFLGTKCTTIGDRAFMSCSNLSDVVLPSSLVTIGEDAFGFTVLNAITIPSSVREIKENAFRSVFYDDETKITFQDTTNWYANGEMVDLLSLKTRLANGWHLIKN